MARWLKYFLSGIILLGCTQDKPAEPVWQNMNEEERATYADSLYDNRLSHYQGDSRLDSFLVLLQSIAPHVEKYPRIQSIAHTKIGDYHVAIPLLEKSYQLNKSESLYYYSWLSLVYYRDYAKALRLLTEYDQLTPNVRDYAWSTNVNYLKGLCLSQMERYHEAIDEFSIAINDEGRHADVYFWVYRGIAYQSLGLHEKALADFTEATSQYPECTMAIYYSAVSYLAMGLTTKSKEMALEAQRLLRLGHKKTDPYVEVFNEVHMIYIDDLLGQLP